MKSFFTGCLLLLLTLIPASPAQDAAEIPQGSDFSTLNKGSREKSYRHRTFRAYLSNDELRRRLKVSNYSSFENPVGILVCQGDQISITLTGSLPGNPLALIVRDWEESGQQESYPLREGKNSLTMRGSGLMYLDYRSSAPQSTPPVSVDIEGGVINGVFTRGDDNATWKKLLADAKYRVMDIIGERCQLIYDVPTLRQHCPDNGSDMLAVYDHIIELEQNDVLGWKRDHCHPGNHIHGRVQWTGFMHADGIGAAFHVSALPELVNLKRLPDNSWGIAHEFGHVNQTRPGMRWVGMSEVTNNICSAWVNYCLNPRSMRLEHETVQNADNEVMRGGRFDCYINNAIVRRRLWQYHGGPDFDGILKPPGKMTGDHFVTVCPLWQLMLYLTVARGNTDFYPAIYSNVRATDESKMTNGQLRTLFFKRACDAAKLDLSDFFLALGMISPINRLVEDYGSSFMTVTRQMCRDAISHAHRFPKPDSSVIYYITANSVHIYKQKLPVSPPPVDLALSISKGRMEIPAGVWSNAVAFEAYNGKKLLRVSLLGLNHDDNASTTVICPKGTNCVKAVQWDGKRYTIYTAQAQAAN